MKCTLAADINKCEYFNRETQECSYEIKCSFQKEEENNDTGYIRQERWYEKYYRKK